MVIDELAEHEKIDLANEFKISNIKTSGTESEVQTKPVKTKFLPALISKQFA